MRVVDLRVIPGGWRPVLQKPEPAQVFACRVRFAGGTLRAGVALLRGTRSMWVEIYDKNLSKLEMILWARPLIHDHPIFGIGRGAFESVFPAYRALAGSGTYTHAENFLAQVCREYGTEPRKLSADAIDWMLTYRWPGNVRELENTIQRACALCNSDVLLPSDIPLGSKGTRHHGPASTVTRMRDALTMLVNMADKTPDIDLLPWVERELTRIARAIGDAEFAFLGRFFTAFCLAEAAEVDESVAMHDELMRLAAESRNFYFAFLAERLPISIDVARCRPDVAADIDRLATTYAGTYADTDGTWALHTGARALRGILEKLMLEQMFEIPGSRDIEGVTVTAAVVRGEGQPIIRHRQEEAAA